MEQKKDRNGIIVLLLMVIVVLLAFILLLLTGKIDPKTNQNGSSEQEIVLTNEEASKIVNGIMDKFYTEVFYGHKETYCGGYDSNDVITTEAYRYYKSTAYNSLDELKEHLKTYMSSNLVDYMLGGNDASKYQQKGDKLYCLVWGRGALVYDKNGSTYSVSATTDTTIVATANVSALAEGDAPTTIEATLGFDKIDGKWVLSTYEEK